MESKELKTELFYIVARTSEDCWEQITNGINTYEDAVSYKDGAFCKERYPNAFIVATVTVKTNTMSKKKNIPTNPFPKFIQDRSKVDDRNYDDYILKSSSGEIYPKLRTTVADIKRTKTTEQQIQETLDIRVKMVLEEAILFQFPKIKRSEISYTDEGLQIDTVSGVSQKEVIEFVDSFRNGKKEGSK